MVETEIGYKAVRLSRGKYYSSSCWEKLWVPYKVGEKTYPKIEGSKLFAFSEVGAALRFAGKGPESVPRPDMKVFRAELENPFPPHSTLDFFDLSRKSIKKFWADPDYYLRARWGLPMFELGGKAFFATSPFTRTLVCDSITLLEEI